MLWYKKMKLTLLKHASKVDPTVVYYMISNIITIANVYCFFLFNKELIYKITKKTSVFSFITQKNNNWRMLPWTHCV